VSYKCSAYVTNVVVWL